MKKSPLSEITKKLTFSQPDDLCKIHKKILFRRLRTIIENDFGMWKGRFPVLQNGIKCKSVRKAGRLVMALGALNNFIVLQTTEQEMANAVRIYLLTRNPSIYNILRWVAWTMGQTNRRPRV